eukprot:gnl/Chilomastix_cuspidata/5628.p1 GENE.gnl/Chilomastix_cuspidata/5628~~gnl/Chilomastix_cuspidata/5628.p1  ORF type:complete len:787 (+),score=126.10 gnl/Chilomastix_cuspidata/5628:148-2361(+)
MGFPGYGHRKLYRNSINKVASLLDKNHGKDYYVFNLSEKTYPSSKFHEQMIHFPFPDHHSPSLRLLCKICTSLHRWLEQRAAHTVAVHCLAGRGRTGTAIVCYLLYSQQIDTPDNAFLFFRLRRSHNGAEGVSVPSQLRCARYFSQLIHRERTLAPLPISLARVVVRLPREFTIWKSSEPVSLQLLLFAGPTKACAFNSAWVGESVTAAPGDAVEFALGIALVGDFDVQLVAGREKPRKEKAIGQLTLHTGFLRAGEASFRARDIDLCVKKREYGDMEVTLLFEPVHGLPAAAPGAFAQFEDIPQDNGVRVVSSYPFPFGHSPENPGWPLTYETLFPTRRVSVVTDELLVSRAFSGSVSPSPSSPTAGLFPRAASEPCKHAHARAPCATAGGLFESLRVSGVCALGEPALQVHGWLDYALVIDARRYLLVSLIISRPLFELATPFGPPDTAATERTVVAMNAFCIFLARRCSATLHLLPIIGGRYPLAVSDGDGSSNGARVLPPDGCVDLPSQITAAAIHPIALPSRGGEVAELFVGTVLGCVYEFTIGLSPAGAVTLRGQYQHRPFAAPVAALTLSTTSLLAVSEAGEFASKPLDARAFSVSQKAPFCHTSTVLYVNHPRRVIFFRHGAGAGTCAHALKPLSGAAFRMREAYHGHPGCVVAAGFIRFGALQTGPSAPSGAVVTCSDTGAICVWDPHSGFLLQSYRADFVSAFVTSTRVLLGHEDGRLVALEPSWAP